jgi:hypothetical protein
MTLEPTAAKDIAEKPMAPTASTISPPQPQTPSHAAIARRAYEIWVKKGHPIGHELMNWREAEVQLRAEQQAWNGVGFVLALAR